MIRFPIKITYSSRFSVFSGHNFFFLFSRSTRACSSIRCFSANGRMAKYRANGLTNLIAFIFFNFSPIPISSCNQWTYIIWWKKKQLFSRTSDVSGVSKTLMIAMGLISPDLSDKQWSFGGCCPSRVGKSSRNSVLCDKSCGQNKWPVRSWLFVKIAALLAVCSSMTGCVNENEIITFYSRRSLRRRSP